MKRLAIVLVAAMLGLATPLYAADKDAKMAAKPAATADSANAVAVGGGEEIEKAPPAPAAENHSAAAPQREDR